jgi:hypothetical protein
MIGLITKDLRSAAVIKDLLLAAIVFPMLYWLIRDYARQNRFIMGLWVVIGAVVFLNPVVIKHASQLTYEEGLLIAPMILWTFALLFLVKIAIDGSGSSGLLKRLVTIVLVIGLFMQFTKCSMLLCFALTASVVLFVAIQKRSRYAAIALGLSLCSLLAWGVRNDIVSGRFTVMTSWDGANLYQGWNNEAAKVFPQVVLDRLFDSGGKVIYLENGDAVPVPYNPVENTFKTEWDWNDFYVARAKQWGRDHPMEAARYTFVKAWNLLVTVRRSPYTNGTDARIHTTSTGKPQPFIENSIITVWLAVGRLFELLAVILIIVLWRRHDLKSRALALIASAIMVAYSAPYLVGFNYERHTTLLLVLVVISTTVLLAEVLQPGERLDNKKDA